MLRWLLGCMQPRLVTVLGGGITGLSATFHLARRYPGTRIVLLEKEARLGGWLNSQTIAVNDHKFIVESGPRTLRPNNKALLELIHLLKLEGRVIRTPSTSPAAKDRFLHIPGTRGLTAIPSSIKGLLRSSLAPALAVAILKDLFSGNNRQSNISDESVDSFLSRRFGPVFAQKFGSALVHGIYAADSRILSIRAAFPSMWDAHLAGGGSVIRSMLRRSLSSRQAAQDPQDAEYQLGGMPEFMKGISVFSFRGGISDLSGSLKTSLNGLPNVEIQQTNVKSIKPVEAGIEISTGNGVITASHAVSTMPLPSLALTLPSHPLPHLQANPFSSVTVVNLVFDRPPNEIHPPGFGYLIPRRSDNSTEVDDSQLSRSMLGTVFDSSALSAQDNAEGFTKLTVMLGGPHTAPSEIDISELITVLSSHLSRKLPNPVAHRIHRQVDCIPTPTVGHRDRMKELREILAADPWRDRLAVIGAGVGGVSVGDCISAGRDVAGKWS